MGRRLIGCVSLLAVMAGAGCSALGDDPFGDAAISDAEMTTDAAPVADAPPVPDAPASPDADLADAMPSDA